MTIAISRALEAAFQQAGEDARRLRHADTTPDHLLAALLRQAEVVAILRDCGCDPENLLRELREYLELLPELPARSRRNALPDGAYMRIVESALRRVVIAAKKEFAPSDVLLQLLADKDSYAGMLLRAEGLGRLELLRRISHGSAQPPLTKLDKAMLTRAHLVQIVLHNDDYTSMEFVTQVLREVFRCSAEESVQLMLHVHRHGKTIVGKYPGDMARSKAELVTTMAAKQDFPLLCTIEALPEMG